MRWHKRWVKRAKLFGQQNGLCYWCEQPMSRQRKPMLPSSATFDHIVPRSKGGGNNLENLVLACNFCNSRRGGLDADEFRIFIKVRGRVDRAKP